MRKYIKRELLATVDLLVNANEMLLSNAENDLQEMNNLLIDCQQSAIEMGNRIEQTEGEGTITVHLLEEYCENVYLIGEALTNMQPVKQLLKKNRNLLTKIANSIQYDLPDSKKEIVFLPYKASMWDSLESVWMAAKEDDSCNTHVIPIPYFDKNKDSSLGQMHYEGGDYPDYVPITSWEEYSIPERRPDVIYIHNPYDNHNFVTSIHPSFYAKELKNYTDMLIYIPYFVCMDDVPEHFCVLPGTMYADRVIVQSEKIRQTYINEFHKFEVNYNCRGRFGNAEEKFLALGSPKFDKVNNSVREDYDIPIEWEKLFVRPDGTRKKVILYNTSVQLIMEHKEKMIEKIKSVLVTFHENPNVVLLWRPHPLSEATMEAMTPGLLKEYKAIVDAYKAEGWGIFDDTADLNRAIAISDAYYGDGSSVVALYQMTGKPIMIQNIDIFINYEYR